MAVARRRQPGSAAIAYLVVLWALVSWAGAAKPLRETHVRHKQTASAQSVLTGFESSWLPPYTAPSNLRSLSQAGNGPFSCCGDIFERCCAGGWCRGASQVAGAICIDTEVSLDLCVPCGKKYQRCCSGDTCADGHVCDVAGTDAEERNCIECGDWLRPCCKKDDGRTYCFREWTSCQGSSAVPGEFCLPCGDIDQPCCPSDDGPSCRSQWQCAQGVCRPCEEGDPSCDPLAAPKRLQGAAGKRIVPGHLGQPCDNRSPLGPRQCYENGTRCMDKDFPSPIGSLLDRCVYCGGIDQLHCETGEACALGHVTLVPEDSASPPNCQPCGEFGYPCCPGDSCKSVPYGDLVCAFANEQLGQRCMLELDVQCKVLDFFHVPPPDFQNLLAESVPFVEPPLNFSLPLLDPQVLRVRTRDDSMGYFPELCRVESRSRSSLGRDHSDASANCSEVDLFHPTIEDADAEGLPCCTTETSEGFILHAVRSRTLAGGEGVEPPLGAAPGRSVVMADVNADGTKDVVFTDAVHRNNTGCTGAAVRLLRLDSNGNARRNGALSTITLQQAGLDPAGWFDGCRAFGQSLAVIGDVDGNGAWDVAVGYPNLPARSASTANGGVIILLLNTDGTLLSSNIVQLMPADSGPLGRSDVPGSPATPAFGSVVSGVGDIDGDGIPDLLATSQGSQARGGVQYWMLFLDATGGVRNVTSVLPGEFRSLPNTNNPDFSSWNAVAGLGDVNGDGIPDIAVADSSGSADGRTGAVWIIKLKRNGRPDVDIPATSISPTGAFAFGMSLSSPGDINGDGISDLLVSDYSQEGTNFNQTVFMLFLNERSQVMCYQPLARLRLMPWSEYHPSGSMLAWNMQSASLIAPEVQADDTTTLQDVPFFQVGCFGLDGAIIESGQQELTVWFTATTAESEEACNSSAIPASRQCQSGVFESWISMENGSSIDESLLHQNCVVATESPSDGGLSTGAITGIIVPTVLGVLVVASAGVWMYKRQKDQHVKELEAHAEAKATQKVVAAIAGEGEINPAAIDVLINRRNTDSGNTDSGNAYAPPEGVRQGPLLMSMESGYHKQAATLLDQLRQAEQTQMVEKSAHTPLVDALEVVAMEGAMSMDLDGSYAVVEPEKESRDPNDTAQPPDWQPKYVLIAPYDKGASSETGVETDSMPATLTSGTDSTASGRRDAAAVIARLMPVLPDVDLNVDPHKDIEFVRRLGRGAFGMVYEGFWTDRTGERQQVAVKVMDISTVDDPKTRQAHLRSFRAELDIMTRIQHENIVRCYGGCLRGSTGVLLLEFMEGGNLDQYVHHFRGGVPLSEIEVLGVANQVSAALAYLHPLVVHCDIKPQNILLNRSGNIKIADFGLSKFKYNTVLSTHVGGTPAYTAPEVVENKKVSEKCDVYSLAMVLWELSTGKRPWSTVHAPFEIYYLVRHKGMRPDIPADLPASLTSLIERAWANSASSRPSANEIFRKTQLLITGMQVTEELEQARTMGSSMGGAAEGAASATGCSAGGGGSGSAGGGGSGSAGEAVSVGPPPRSDAGGEAGGRSGDAALPSG